MKTDYSLLMEGKSPIVAMGMDFSFGGHEEDGGGDDQEEDDEVQDGFQIAKKALVKSMTPKMKRIYELYFE